MLAAGLAITLVAVSQASSWGWTSARTVIPLVGGLAGLVMWSALERRTASPLVDIRTLATRTVLITNIVTFMVGFGLFGAFFLIPQLAQLPTATGFGLGLDAAQAGLLLAPAALLNLALSPISGRLGARYRASVPLALGCLITSAALALLAFDHPTWLAVLLLVLPAGDRHRVRVLRDAQP